GVRPAEGSPGHPLRHRGPPRPGSPADRRGRGRLAPSHGSLTTLPLKAPPSSSPGEGWGEGGRGKPRPYGAGAGAGGDGALTWLTPASPRSRRPRRTSAHQPSATTSTMMQTRSAPQ